MQCQYVFIRVMLGMAPASPAHALNKLLNSMKSNNLLFDMKTVQRCCSLETPSITFAS